MNNIKKARLNAGFSQKQVALSLHVSMPTVSEWESGKKTPRADNLQLLSSLFNVSIDYLLGREEQQKEPVTDTDDGLPDNIKSYIEQIKSMSGEDLALLNAVLDYVRAKREK